MSNPDHSRKFSISSASMRLYYMYTRERRKKRIQYEDVSAVSHLTLIHKYFNSQRSAFCVYTHIEILHWVSIAYGLAHSMRLCKQISPFAYRMVLKYSIVNENIHISCRHYFVDCVSLYSRCVHVFVAFDSCATQSLFLSFSSLNFRKPNLRSKTEAKWIKWRDKMHGWASIE